jgi:hypothetical protein
VVCIERFQQWVACRPRTSLEKKEIRQADIYLSEYSGARRGDRSIFAAQGSSNNARIGAEITRIDG